MAVVSVLQSPLLRVVLTLLWGITTLTAASHYRARSCGGSIRHVHLAVGHDPSSQMTVSFSSVRSYHVPLVGGILIGTHPDQLDVYIEEEQHRFYNATPNNKKNGEYYSPLLHHIRITDLDPATTYYYKCTVRRRHEIFPMDASTSGAALRGSSSTKNKSKNNQHGKSWAEIEEQQIVMKAEERGEDEYAVDSEEEDDNNPGRQRRQLDLNYYDSNRGECPPPNKIRSFQTAPPLGQLDRTKVSSITNTPSLKFVYVGDIGQFEHSQENIMHLVTHQQNRVNAIMLAGDIAYSGYDNRRWDTFFDFMDDFFMIDEVPMHVCAGNHDIDKVETSDEIFLAYEHRFDMPQIKPAQLGTYQGPKGLLDMDSPPYPLPYEYGNAYYAFSYGMSHNIFLNAYSSMEPDSLQYKWLVQELQSVDRSVTPWLIVTMHVPVYNSFDVHHHDLQIVAAKEHMEPLFVEYKVNLVVTGHIHAYQRTKNVAMDKLDPTGPVHVVVGAGGRQCKAMFETEEPASWAAVRDATRYGYGTLEIFNETHAQWDWIVTGHSEYNDVNVLWKNEEVTFPAMEHPDTVVIENQIFIDK